MLILNMFLRKNCSIVEQCLSSSWVRVILKTTRSATVSWMLTLLDMIDCCQHWIVKKASRASPLFKFRLTHESLVTNNYRFSALNKPFSSFGIYGPWLKCIFTWCSCEKGVALGIFMKVNENDQYPVNQ